MTMKKIALIMLAALGFATLMLYMLTGQGRSTRPPVAGSAPAALVFNGKLDIRAMDDLRVDGRRIILCGVSFTKPRSLESVARDLARKVYQGQQLSCVQVGGGTPCDGRVGASFNGAVVVQCHTEQGADIAREMSDRGFLCDLPAQSGSIYSDC